jgi:hypothetical protein
MSASPDSDDDLQVIEARLPASVAMGVVAILYLTLPSAISPGPTFVIPLLILLVFGKRANEILPKVRDWMNANSWMVSEGVIALFIAIEISSVV